MDARTKKIVGVLCVACVVLAWRLYVVIAEYALSSAKAEPTVALLTDEVAGTASGDDDRGLADMELVLQRQQTVANGPWGRDPFADVAGMEPAPNTGDVETPRFKHGSEPEPPEIAFTGASMSGGRWLAVVDGRIVRVGDVIDDKYEVIDIQKWTITVAAGPWTYAYKLGSSVALSSPRSEE